MRDHTRLACTLEAGELMERISEWQSVTSRAIDRRVEGGKVTATYPREADLLRRLLALIAAEATCCSFMRFDVTEREHDLVVELTVPEGMAPQLAQMLGLAVPA